MYYFKYHIHTDSTQFGVVKLKDFDDINNYIEDIILCMANNSEINDIYYKYEWEEISKEEYEMYLGGL